MPRLSWAFYHCLPTNRVLAPSRRSADILLNDRLAKRHRGCAGLGSVALHCVPSVGLAGQLQRQWTCPEFIHLCLFLLGWVSG